MTPDVRAHLESWLASDDPVRRKHAEWRLSLPDDYSPPAEPAVHFHDEWSARIHACPDFNPGCCASPAPYCTRFGINPTRERCIECLEGGG